MFASALSRLPVNMKAILDRRQSLFILFLLLGLGVRILFILSHQRPLISDEREYHNLAITLAETGKYAINGQPTAYRPIGYPTLLAAVYAIVGVQPLAAKMLQALLDTLTAFLLFHLTPATDQQQRYIAMGLWIFYTPAILYTNLLLSESIFTFGLVLLSLLVTRFAARSPFGTLLVGLLFGILILIKPGTTLFLFAVMTLLLASRFSLRNILLMMLGAAVIVFPWVIRNSAMLGSPTLATSGGINLLIGNNPLATGSYTARFPMQVMLGTKTEPEADAAARTYALKYIGEHPGVFLLNAVRKLAHLFSSEGGLLVWSFHPNPKDAAESFASKYASVPFPLILVINASYIFTLLVGLAGFVSAPRTLLWRFVLALVLSWFILHAVFFGGSRFHHPLMPFLAVFASSVLTRADGFQTPQNRRVRFFLAGGTIILIAVWAIEFLIVMGVQTR